MARQDQRRDQEQEGPEMLERLVAVNRVAKVVKGGRRFGFAALMVIGDGNGQVGFGTGKAKEVPDAIRKATDDAKRNMIRIPLREGRTIHHDITSKSNGTANPHNMVRATLEALKNIQSPRQIAARRGKKVGDVIANREVMAGTVAGSEE